MAKIGPYQAGLLRRRQAQAGENVVASPKTVQSEAIQHLQAASKLPINIDGEAWGKARSLVERAKFLSPGDVQTIRLAVERTERVLATQLAKIAPIEQDATRQGVAAAVERLAAEVPNPVLGVTMGGFADLLETAAPRLSVAQLGQDLQEFSRWAADALGSVAAHYRGLEGLSVALNVIPQLFALAVPNTRLSVDDSQQLLHVALEIIRQQSPLAGPDSQLASDICARAAAEGRGLAALTATRDALSSQKSALPQFPPMRGAAAPLIEAIARAAASDPNNSAIATSPVDLAYELAAYAEQMPESPAWARLTEVVHQAAGQPSADSTISAALAGLPRALARADGLEAAINGGLPPLLALSDYSRERIEGIQFNVFEVPELRESVEALLVYPAGPRMVALLSQLPFPDPFEQAAAARGLAALMKQQGVPTDVEAKSYLRRFSDAFVQCKGLDVHADYPARMAHAIAANTSGDSVDEKTIGDLTRVSRELRQYVPDLNIDEVVGRKGKLGGLIALNGLKSEVVNKVSAWTRELVKWVGQTPSQNEPDLHRFVLRLSLELAQIEDGPASRLRDPLGRALRAGLSEPHALQFPDGSRATTILEAVAEHAEYPPELLPIALTRLNKDQLTWLSNFFKTNKNRTETRALRDAVLFSIDVGRPQFVDALRTSPSAESIRAVSALVSEGYRQNNQLSWEQLEVALAEGRNPVAEAQAAALASLNLAPPEGDPIDEVGAGEIAHHSVTIAAFSAFLQTNKPAIGAQLYPCLTAMMGGRARWEAKRYEGPIATRQLAGLSESSVARWKTNEVTEQGSQSTSSTAEAAHNSPEFVELVSRISRFSALLDQATPPPIAGVEMTIAGLSTAQASTAETLRGAEKGSPAHLTAIQKMRPIQDALALLQVQNHLAQFNQTAVEQKPENIDALRQALLSDGAKRGLRVAGGDRLLNAARDIVDSMEGEARSQLTNYAADEDTLDAALTSFMSNSCMNPVQGYNRAGLMSFITDPQYKFIRVYWEGKPVIRGMLRLFDFRVGDQTTKMLWVDTPSGVAEVNQRGSQEQTDLYYKHALAKARALGVPLVGPPGSLTQNGLGSSGDVVQLPLGSQVTVDAGHTGLHQSEGLKNNHYWIARASTGMSTNMTDEDLNYSTGISGEYIAP